VAVVKVSRGKVHNTHKNVKLTLIVG